MRKTLIIGLLGGATLLGGVPYWSGRVAEAQFAKAQADFAQGSGLVLLDGHYRRGWLASEARTAWGTDAGAASLLVLEHSIRHGLPPLIDPRVETRLLPETGGGLPPAQLDTRIALLGESTASLDMPAFRRAAGALPLESGGVTGQVRFRLDGGALSGQLHSPSLQIGEGSARLALRSADLRFNDRRGAADARQGSFAAALPEADYRLPYLPEGSARAVALSGNWEIRGEEATLRLHLEAGRLDWDGQSYGPATLDLRLEHLDTAALRGLFQGLQTAQRAGGATQFRLLATWALMQHLPALFARNPAIHLENFRIATPHGEAGGHFRLDLAPPAGAPESVPLAALRRLQAEGEAHAPKALLAEFGRALLRYTRWAEGQAAPADAEAAGLARQWAAQLGQGWLAGGYVTEQAEMYRASLQLRDGRITINGKERAFAELW